MIKQIYYIGLICFLFTYNIFKGQNQILKQACMTIGTSGNTDVAQSIIQTPDTGFLLVGYTYGGFGSADGYIVKLNKAGTFQWSLDFGTGAFEVFYDVVYLGDGTYVAIGHTKGIPISSGDNSYNVLAIRFDLSGNILWKKAYGTTLDEQAFSAVYDVDKNAVVIVGLKQFSSNNDKGVLLIRIDPSNGSIIDYKCYTTSISFNGKTEVDYARDIIITYDRNYVITGLTRCPSCSSQDILLLKVNSNNLNTIWSYALDANSNSTDEGYALEEAPDITNDIIVAGATYSSSTKNDIYVARITSNASSVVWDNIVGGSNNDAAYDIVLSDGACSSGNAYWLVGETKSYGLGTTLYYDVYVVAVNENTGQVCSAKSYGGARSDYARSVINDTLSSLHGFVIAGAYDQPTADFDMYMIELDKKKNDCGCYTGTGFTERNGTHTLRSLSPTTPTLVILEVTGGSSIVSSSASLNSQCSVLPMSEIVSTSYCKHGEVALFWQTPLPKDTSKHFIVQQICKDSKHLIAKLPHDRESYYLTFMPSPCLQNNEPLIINLSLVSNGTIIAEKTISTKCQEKEDIAIDNTNQIITISVSKSSEIYIINAIGKPIFHVKAQQDGRINIPYITFPNGIYTLIIGNPYFKQVYKIPIQH